MTAASAGIQRAKHLSSRRSFGRRRARCWGNIADDSFLRCGTGREAFCSVLVKLNMPRPDSFFFFSSFSVDDEAVNQAMRKAPRDEAGTMQAEFCRQLSPTQVSAANHLKPNHSTSRSCERKKLGAVLDASFPLQTFSEPAEVRHVSQIKFNRNKKEKKKK